LMFHRNWISNDMRQGTLFGTKTTSPICPKQRPQGKKELR
jgi:hypothetical protein